MIFDVSASPKTTVPTRIAVIGSKTPNTEAFVAPIFLVALAKCAMGGRLGLDIDLTKVPAEAGLTDAEILFSESNSRFIVTCKPEKAAELEKALAGFDVAKIGTVTADSVLKLNGANGTIAIELDQMVESYKKTLAGV